MTQFLLPEFRSQFPILQQVINGYPLIYCDNAATTQKPIPVIQAVASQLEHCNANVHRGAHHLSANATTLYEQSRDKVAAFINAPAREQVIWTKGTTESINLLVATIGMQRISKGDEIVISVAEHHANIVPWQQLAQQCDAKLVILPVDESGRIDVEKSLPLVTEKCKFLSINHASNVLGKVNPIQSLFSKAKSVNAITVLDAAQTVAHLKIDVQSLDVDFVVFSAHKMFGPAGLGILYGRKALLDAMPPYQFGGEMIKKVSFECTQFNEIPHKFEAGTPNLTAVIAMGACIDFLSSDQYQQALQYEQDLIAYAYQKLNQVKGLRWLVTKSPDLPIFSFTLSSLHHQDLASYLDSKGIAVRSGHHCAMPLMQYLQLSGCVRVSLAPYNSYQEIDTLVQCINQFVNEDFSAAAIADAQQSELVKIPMSDSTEESHGAMNLQWQQLRQKFSRAQGWDAKHREIMLLGKALPRMAKSERSDDILISGCESNAWLKIDEANVDGFSFVADSDARVIRGLLFIILIASENKTPQQITRLDFEPLFAELGLMQHLSPSRGNGLLAIVKRIKELAGSQA
ncbi:SufS family cysteine desulfurase [Thalassotalea litorea]|uniref:cysteine desulfurase n=1 Tax=Thalassotalea litorea TaxID=2020715 RepID=A0A5R9IWQ9_9GAMM|nr:SufS family cysteine desulfurase [Thalassotalea litorea]TLU66358.1 SufS family cysteine desulfurase [Thalassotalea litorea]